MQPSPPIDLFDEARALIPRLDAATLAVDDYRRAGVFVVRGAIPSAQVRAWQEAWSRFAGALAGARRVDPFNPVAMHEPAPDELACLHACPALLDLMQQVYPDLALYQQRFVIKDAHSRGPVFLHQDYGYDHGWPEKTAVFVPLSRSGPDNGGLVLYPGTHRLGYLGDTGEVDPSCLGVELPSLCPELDPGDVLLMHECTWHASLPHRNGPDRILAQVTYQPADDPSGVASLRGRPLARPSIGPETRARLFLRSRAGRLRELQAENDRLRLERQQLAPSASAERAEQCVEPVRGDV